MSSTEQATVPPERPSGRFPWLKLVLVVSLALNLLVLGAAATRFVVHGPPERMSGISEMQLIPRKFFGDLDRGRRGELLAVFKGFRDEFREGRDARKQFAASLAAALEAEPYDGAKVADAVAAFNQRSAGMISRGGDAALEFIAKLTPDERKLLAQRIRERVDGGRKGDR